MDFFDESYGMWSSLFFLRCKRSGSRESVGGYIGLHCKCDLSMLPHSNTKKDA